MSGNSDNVEKWALFIFMFFVIFFLFFFFVKATGSQYRGVKELHAAPKLVIMQQCLFISQLYTSTVWKSAQSPGKKWCNCMFLLSTDILYFGWYATFDMYHINISTLCVIPRSDEMCKCWLYIQGGERMVGGVTSERPLCENTSAWCRFGRHQIISWPCYWAQNQVFLPDIKGISSCVSGFMNLLSQIMFFLSLT